MIINNLKHFSKSIILATFIAPSVLIWTLFAMLCFDVESFIKVISYFIEGYFNHIEENQKEFHAQLIKMVMGMIIMISLYFFVTNFENSNNENQ